MSKSSLRGSLSVALALACAMAPVSGVLLAQEPSQTEGAKPTIQILTPPPGKLVTGVQNWTVTDPKNFAKVRSKLTKASIQVVVVSIEELAAMGAKGNGSVIYRYVDGLLQIVVTSVDAANAVVAEFPEHTELPQSTQSPDEAAGGTNAPADQGQPGTNQRSGANRFMGPNQNQNQQQGEDDNSNPGFDDDDNGPTADPGDFQEKPQQENVSPS